MTTKEWLMRAWKIDEEIDALLVAKQKAYERCTSVTTKPRNVMVSSSADPDAPLVAWQNIEKLIDDRVDQLTKVKAEILAAIEAVQDCILRALLIARYINFKTWEQIAVDLDFSYQWVCRLHGKALKENKLVDSN